MRVMIASINPTTGETLKTFEPLTESQVDARIGCAEQAFRSYRHTSYADRAKWLTRAAEILESEQDRLGRIITLEMGKPLAAARAEAAKCALGCRYYVEHGERLLADEPVDMGAGRALIRYQPIGPVLAIMPWNFPLWQAYRFVAPALMAGNVGLLKHASNVPQCALEIEQIVRRAGFPDDVFQTLLIGASQVERIIRDPRVRGVTLTGSEPAGQQVASTAGYEIKRSVLELGGSDPFIVMPSADMDKAVATATEARCVNNGQSCIAAKRFILHGSIAGEFTRRFVDGMKALRVGDPMQEGVQIGPLATPQIVNDLDQQVTKSVQMGAKLLTGGRRLESAGNFYEPTVLADPPKESPAYREELFGPVAVIFRVENLEDAIRLANDSTFGLGASAWTTDAAEQEAFANEIESGMVFINSMVVSDPRIPFGGFKRSGYGRELSQYGIREFQNIKTVRVM
jgi:succinate-semialdehyde dehydrogenase/glutarate-semialdehyde dehydrogenase